MRYAVIMAGGAGTRLWPMSRKRLPKQLIPFIEGRSLLELAWQRLDGLLPPGQRLICAGESFRDLIMQRLPDLRGEQLLGEPEGRDTLNAIGLSAAVLCGRDPEAVFAVLTADHLIEPGDRFRETLARGFALVEEKPDRLVTFSITPTHPATSFGYIERGERLAGHDEAFRVRRFVEKPDHETAAGYLATGRYGWNSGMFIFSAKRLMALLEERHPANAAGLRAIANAWNSPERERTLAAVYPTLAKTSIDYGLIEPASTDPSCEVCTVPMNLSWRDIGSWPSYAETLEVDAHGHRANAVLEAVDSSNVVGVAADGGTIIAAVGVRDLIIVHTPDAVLVCHKDHAERVKEIVARIDESKR